MKNKIMAVVFIGVLILGFSLIVLTGCQKEPEEKGGAITVVNISEFDYHFAVFDPGNKNVHGTTHDVRAKGNKRVTVAKNDTYEIAYSRNYYSLGSGEGGGKKYISVSGGESVTVEIPEIP